MPAYLSPIGNDNFVDSSGNPLSGGKLYTYSAGSSTPAATYTSSTGATPQANPIILNARGVPDNPVWIAGSSSIKFVITDSADVTLQTIDGVSGVNDPALVSSQDEWVTLALTPTYLSATSFSVAGDQTTTIQAGRRLKSVNSGGTIYSSVSSSSFGAGITTVVVVNDSGTLDSGLSSVSYGLLSATNPSIPRLTSQVRLWGTGGFGSTATKVRRFASVVVNQGSDITFADSATNGTTLTINTAGTYSITYTDNAGAGTEVVGVSLNANGATAIRSLTSAEVLCSSATAGANLEGSCCVTLYLASGSVLRPHTQGGSAAGTGLIQLSIQRVA